MDQPCRGLHCESEMMIVRNVSESPQGGLMHRTVDYRYQGELS